MAIPDSPLTAVEAILRRRATRRFDPDRPIPDATLKQILRLATHAPSGYNLQPWRFVVVRSPRNRERLRDCAYGQAKIAEAPVVLIVLGYHNPHRSHLEAIVSQSEALGAFDHQAAMAIRANAARALDRVPDPALWATRSSMIAAATLMIAAESLGVQSAPMEGFDPFQVRGAFGVPDDHTICALIALGYAAEIKPFPGRLPLAEVCYEEHFGQPWPAGD